MSIYSDIRKAVSDMVDTRDYQKLLEVKVSLMEKISSAQDQYLELCDRFGVLKARNEELEAIFNDKQNYRLYLLSEEKGFWAYKYMKDDEVAHYICQTCLETTGKKQVLRIREDGFCMCPACGQNKGVWLNGEPRVPYRISRSDDYNGF
ncbi:hypothetical protein DQC40_11600 [Salmonella enterica subsp. enterica serovar Coeln]|nr:hypothetical protein [Salmonella enterica subsp. enterica serovar Coeln]